MNDSQLAKKLDKIRERLCGACRQKYDDIKGFFLCRKCVKLIESEIRERKA